MHISHFQYPAGSVAGSIPCMLAKMSLGSSRRYIASNFTDVNYTMSNVIGDPVQQISCCRKEIYLRMPMKG